ncbi:hypothetical protein F2Q69_00030883 [Brassica cretica]|uniref:Uncharacterized protein n=1 Tax=Brassica cretica TaxID=69181 RepID=A0A8S9RS70_BRACR|nr:hypothetical protein F2Q69_00030883 [Brassica cretica]
MTCSWSPPAVAPTCHSRSSSLLVFVLHRLFIFGGSSFPREAAFLNLLWVMGGTVRRGNLMFGYVIPAPVLNRLVHNGGLIHSLIVGLEEQHQNVALTAPGLRIEFLRLRFAKLSGDGINHLEQR